MKSLSPNKSGKVDPRGGFSTNFWIEALERVRLRLADASPGFALPVLGLLSGLIAGAVIIAFRTLIDVAQGFFLLRGRYGEL
jgi:hypothetical protein